MKLTFLSPPGNVSVKLTFLQGFAAMKYGQVEAALVRLFEVDKTRLGAFKARIRHLRNSGCPSIEKVGTGSTAEYSQLHALQLAIALALGQTGLSSKHSAWLAINRAPEISVTDGNQRFLVLLPDVDDSRANPESLNSSDLPEDDELSTSTPAAYEDDEAAGIGGGRALQTIFDLPGVGQSVLCESAGKLLGFAELMHAMSFVNVSNLVRDLEQALKQVEAA